MSSPAGLSAVCTVALVNRGPSLVSQLRIGPAGPTSEKTSDALSNDPVEGEANNQHRPHDMRSDLKAVISDLDDPMLHTWPTVVAKSLLGQT